MPCCTRTLNGYWLNDMAVERLVYMAFYGYPESLAKCVQPYLVFCYAQASVKSNQ